MLRVGVIGGSGLDDPQILTDAKEIEVQTPYGDPSSTLTCMFNWLVCRSVFTNKK